jgi:addiction module HigA family antidote
MNGTHSHEHSNTGALAGNRCNNVIKCSQKRLLQSRFPIHPGEILLEDYIKAMGVSVRALAFALYVPYSRLREMTKGERGISADTACVSNAVRQWSARLAESACAYERRIARQLSVK